MWDKLWLDVNLATMREGGAPYGAIEKAALAVKDGRIAWLGPVAELPGYFAKIAMEHVHCSGEWITPGLIDCHTHVIFGGQRWKEFALRLEGATYEEIARSGGGIVSTVEATRAASEDALFDSAAARLKSFIPEGVTTVEIKSGYGLETETELKMLRVARRLGRELPVDVRTTFLGAHALPREFVGRQAAYIDVVCNEMIPRVAAENLADAVDAFCEGIAFTPEETGRVFEAAAAHGLRVKLHADQLSDLGGAALAAHHRALSADHLECTGEAGVRAMAEAGTVAVVLPGANYFLREARQPPIALLREHRVPIALASNCNPGSSPALSVQLMLSMACTLFRLTPEEALAGVTRNAAKALGLNDRGVLEVGKRADFAIWEVDHPAELSYWIGGNRCLDVHRA
jgi:imidazolonepropionase